MSVLYHVCLTSDIPNKDSIIYTTKNQDKALLMEQNINKILKVHSDDCEKYMVYGSPHFNEKIKAIVCKTEVKD